MEIKEGTTDVTIPYKLRQSANGQAQTGLVYNSAGFKCYYIRGRGLPVQIPLVTLAAVDSAHSDGGFKEKSAGNMKGSYRLDLPDAVCASGLTDGVRYSTVHLEFTGIFAEEIRLDLVQNTAKDIIDQLVLILANTRILSFRKNTALNNFQFSIRDANGDPVSGEAVVAQRILDGGSVESMDNAVAEVGSTGVYRTNFSADDVDCDFGSHIYTPSSGKARVINFMTVL